MWYRPYWAMERWFGVRFPPVPYEDVLRDIVTPATRWLDVGCGHQVLDSWRAEQERSLVAHAAQVTGLDPSVPALRDHRSVARRVGGDLDHLPFPDRTFTLVTARMVAEHLDAPQRQFAEIARVLAPGGRFVFLTPNGAGYTVRLAKLLPGGLKPLLARLLEGRREADVFPTHYRANTDRAIRALAAGAGLEVAEIRFCLGTAVFAVVPPLAALELLWMKLLMRPAFAALRPRLIAVLRKPG